VCQTTRLPSNFHDLLLQCDEAIAEEVRTAGCRHCGGRLHRANYPRKPFGLKRFRSRYEQRFSLCCATDGCRRRSTPPSMRFLGRRRYIAVLMLLSSTRSGRPSRRCERLRRAIGVSQRTMTRWRRWWRCTMLATPTYRVLCGRQPAVRNASMPAALIAVFNGTLRVRLLHTLAALLPLTIDRPDYSRVDFGTQIVSLLAGASAG